MNRDDIIRMAREAEDYADTVYEKGEYHPGWLEVRDAHFAALVAAAERERMTVNSIHTCHTECDRPGCVAVRKAVEAEREAICSIVYGLCASDNEAQRIVNAIRARGSK